MHGIRSARLVLIDRILENAWLTVDQGVIAAFGQGERPARVEWQDAEQLYVSPGLIDLHVHGGNGADALDGTPEALLKMSDYHLAHGTTSLCPTLISTTQCVVKFLRQQRLGVLRLLADGAHAGK